MISVQSQDLFLAFLMEIMMRLYKVSHFIKRFLIFIFFDKKMLCHCYEFDLLDKALKTFSKINF